MHDAFYDYDNVTAVLNIANEDDIMLDLLVVIVSRSK